MIDQAEAARRRADIQSSLTQARAAFQELLGSLTEDDLAQKRSGSGWGAREVATHVVSSIQRVPMLIAALRHGKDYMNYPLPVFERLKRLHTWWMARDATPGTLAHRLDAAYPQILALVETIRDDEWERSGRVPASARARGGAHPADSRTPRSIRRRAMGVVTQVRDGRLGGVDVGVRAAVLMLVVAGISFPLTFKIWPPMLPAGWPAAAQVSSLGLLTAECLAMGGGVAFLILGYPALKRLPVSPPLAVASYLGIGYYLVNWWTHDHLHYLASTLDFPGWVRMTLGIEYVFHVGMTVFAAVLALLFAKILLAGPATEPAVPAARAAGERVSTVGSRWRFAMLVLVIAVVSVPISLALFHPRLPGGATLPAAAIPFFLGLKTFEGLALGVGIGFLLFGHRVLRRAEALPPLALLTYLSISWFLVNWWLHDNLHAVNGDNLWGLIGIEYGFHLTMMLAAGVLAVFFYRVTPRSTSTSRGDRT